MQAEQSSHLLHQSRPLGEHAFRGFNAVGDPREIDLANFARDHLSIRAQAALKHLPRESS